MDIDLRLYPLLVLLAVAPVAWYLTTSGRNIVVLSVVSVALIAAAVYIMFTGGFPGLGRAS
jgi:hypothetical protein